MKQIKDLEKSTNLVFDSIILDILNGFYTKYDYRKLSWYKSIYRIRIWEYRIIFKDQDWNIKILLIWKRWDIYKLLKQLYS